jgi:hypothetical protein
MPRIASHPPTTIVLVRRLFVIAAALDFVAMITFLVVYATNRAAIADWVTNSSIFAGEISHDGVAATVNYTTIVVCVVHIVITAVFLWLAVAVGRGRRRTRATVLLVGTACIDGFVITVPVAGLAQQLVMIAAVALKVVALVVLWAPSSRTFFQHTGVPVAERPH